MNPSRLLPQAIAAARLVVLLLWLPAALSLGTLTNARTASTLAIDVSASTHQAGPSSTIVSPAFSTRVANEVIVVFVGTDGPNVSNGQSISSVTGGGLGWVRRAQSNAQAGVTEIWQAVAATVVSNVTVTATLAVGGYGGSLTVVSFSGADTVTNGATAVAGAASGAPSISLNSTRSGSWVWGAGNDWDGPVPRTCGAGQAIADQYVDTTAGDTYWTQYQTATTAAPGAAVTINDTAPITDRWNMAAIEILPAGPDTTPPVISAVSAASVTSSGATISWTTDKPATSQVLYGTTSAYGSSSLDTTLVQNHSQTLAGLTPATTYHFQVVSRDAYGNTASSPDYTFTTTIVDTTPPTIDPSTPAATPVPNNVPAATTPPFSPPANTVVYAVFSMDSASYTGQVTTVSSIANSGTALTWHLLGRNNNYTSTAGGFVEVWWAYNLAAQSNITVTATFSANTKDVAPPVGDFQAIVVNHAAPDQSAAAWSANWLLVSQDNSPNVTVTTTRANSLVLAVFDNWNNSETPVPGANQSIQSIVLNTVDVDGYWVQQQNAPTGLANTAVTMSATNPGNPTEWRALAWEVLAAG